MTDPRRAQGAPPPVPLPVENSGGGRAIRRTMIVRRQHTEGATDDYAAHAVRRGRPRGRATLFS